MKGVKQVAQEKEIERYLKNRVEQLGGYCRKWVAPGHNGVPDRIVLLNGHAAFIETKAPDKKARKQQAKEMEEIRYQGFYAGVIDTREKVDEFIREIMME